MDFDFIFAISKFFGMAPSRSAITATSTSPTTRVTSRPRTATHSLPLISMSMYVMFVGLHIHFKCH